MYSYKKHSLELVILQVLLVGFLVVKGIEVNRIAAMPAFQLRFAEDFVPVEKTSLTGMVLKASSGQRVVDYEVMEQTQVLAQSDYDALLRIVEAEAGGEDVHGRILIANVVLNRVDNPVFPDTIEGVVTQRANGKYQFSPLSDGRYYRVVISEETTEAVNRALQGEDYSEGALYFAARRYANPAHMRWFDTHLTRLFSYGGHEFFS